MFGRRELENVRLQKQALILESSLNRQALQVEYRELRLAVTSLTNATRTPRRIFGVLALLAPVAGFFAARSVRRSEGWLSRVTSLAKWIGPLYGMWRSFSAARKKDSD